MGFLSRIRQRLHEKMYPESGSTVPRNVMIGALILIILACLTVTILGRMKPPKKAGVTTGLHFMCLKTHEEFVFDSENMPKEWVSSLMGGPSANLRLKNPKTGEPTVVPMTQCPSCKKHIVPPQFAGGVGASVCRHCNTNFAERRRR